MKRIVYTSLALALGSASALAHAIDGRWAFFAEACTAEYSDGMFTVNVAAGTIEYYESICHIGEVTAVGELGEVWRASMSCSGEGETWMTDTLFALHQNYDGTPNQLVQVDMNQGFVTIAVRCGK